MAITFHDTEEAHWIELEQQDMVSKHGNFLLQERHTRTRTIQIYRYIMNLDAIVWEQGFCEQIEINWLDPEHDNQQTRKKEQYALQELGYGAKKRNKKHVNISQRNYTPDN